MPLVEPQEQDAHIARLKRLDSTQLMFHARGLRARLLRRYLAQAIMSIVPVRRWIRALIAARRMRRELAEYDDRLLRDMGLTRYDVLTHGRPGHALPEQTRPSLRQTLQDWSNRVRQRRMLARFTERDLHDIAISKCDAEFEIRKPRWRR